MLAKHMPDRRLVSRKWKGLPRARSREARHTGNPTRQRTRTRTEEHKHPPRWAMPSWSRKMGVTTTNTAHLLERWTSKCQQPQMLTDTDPWFSAVVSVASTVRWRSGVDTHLAGKPATALLGTSGNSGWA